MKTTHKIAVITLMFISQVNFSQSLLIKGFFKNSNKESIQVDYVLKSNENIICYGVGKKVKIELQLNKDYILTISKDGFITKSVSFSTHTKNNNDFSFEFEVLLDKQGVNKSNLASVSNKVYYDVKIKDFNYEIKRKHQLQY